MGNILVSGNGKSNFFIYLHAILGVILTIGAGVCIYISRQNPSLGFLLIIGLIFLICEPISTIIKCNSISKTKLVIYENEIVGIGVGKYFSIGNFLPIGDFRTGNFRVSFDQVMSVNTEEYSITIIAAGIQYKCFVKNTLEIQTFLLNQIKSGSDPRNFKIENLNFNGTDYTSNVNGVKLYTLKDDSLLYHITFKKWGGESIVLKNGRKSGNLMLYDATLQINGKIYNNVACEVTTKGSSTDIFIKQDNTALYTLSLQKL